VGAPPRRRGRDGGLSADYIYITSELSPTAQRILAAAQRVLQRDGYAGVTLQRVADEAGEHKSLVTYHFGTKATLMTLLVDSLWHDLDVELYHKADGLLPDSELRIEALIDAQWRLGRLTTQQQMYQDLFPNLTRRDDTRRHLAELMRSYRDLHQRFLSPAGLPDDESAALAGLVLAVGDGMAVSLLVRPDEVEDAAAYALLQDMVLSLTREARQEGGGGVAAVAGPRQPKPAPRGDAPAARLAPGGHGAGSEASAEGALPPGEHPLAGLPPVARKLVRGAIRVLRKRGFAGLTLDAVGREAGEPPSSITYYFGDKRGLVTALVEAQFHEQRKLAMRMFGDAAAGEGARACALSAVRELLTDLASFRAFFDLLPVLTRDAELGELLAAHDRWLVDLMAAELRTCADAAVADRADLLALLQLAAADGLAMQALADPHGLDPLPSCAMLEQLLDRHLPPPVTGAGA
jgi:AcrR family transcriptional regulator